MPSVDVKQEIMRINNTLNMQMYGMGVRKQKVLFIDNVVVIIAQNKRIPALAALDQKDRLITRFIDVALLDQFKQKLKEQLNEKLGFHVSNVLKDYDPNSEVAVTTILLVETL